MTNKADETRSEPGRRRRMPVSDADRAPIANAPSGAQPADLPTGPAPLATPARRIFLVGNAHLDPVWLWPWQEGYQEARATFASVVDRMDEYPDFVFTCDQVVLLSWVAEQDPDLFARIKRRVAEGRWVNTGGWWVEPDCNMPMGESFLRQGLLGQRFLLAHFGRAATVGMNVDPFGHHAMIPAILRGQGMDSYCFLRPGPHEADLFATPFWWEAPDGSQVLACRIPHEYCSPPGEVAGQVEKGLGQLDRSFGDLMVFYGVGNHGGGPTKANIESIHRYQRMGSFGELRMTSPREFVDTVIARGENLPVWNHDLQHHAAGCYSAHSGIKAWQRRAQWAVLNAERWAIAADFMSAAENAALTYPREALTRAWQQVLFNQFHDILPGSAIEPAYVDARDQLGEAVSISKRVVNLAHNTIARAVDIPLRAATQPVIVFNSHPWPVRTQVELQYGVQPTGVHVVDADGVLAASQKVQSSATTDDHGRGAVCFDADLPAFGYRLYSLRSGSEDPGDLGLSATTGQLENRHVAARFDASGRLISLMHKGSGVDPLAGAQGPHEQLCEDPTDTWGHRVVSYAWPGAELETAQVLLRETGPVRARLRVVRTWGRSELVEEYILAHDSTALSVEVTLDWRERAHLLKLRLPVGVADPVATYEIPFATLERPVDGAEEPAQSWVDLTGTVDGRTAGLSVIASAKHGFDVSPAADGRTASIGITAVRSAVYAWHDPRLLDESGVYSYQDQGVHRWTYQLVPHAGDWRTGDLTRRAAELGLRPRAMLESFHRGPLPGSLSLLGTEAAGAGSVMVTAVKGGEDDVSDSVPLVVRAVETHGLPGRLSLALPIVGRRLEADFGPYQIRTFRIPRDGGRVTETDLVERPLDEPALFEVSDIEGLPSLRPTRPKPGDTDARTAAEIDAPGMRNRAR